MAPSRRVDIYGWAAGGQQLWYIYGWAAGAPPLALLTIWVLTHAVVAPQVHASRLVSRPLLQVFGLILWPLRFRLASRTSIDNTSLSPSSKILHGRLLSFPDTSMYVVVAPQKAIKT